MKVALIIERLDKKLGGAETSVWELFNELKNQHVDVTLITAKSNIKDDDIIELCDNVKSKRVGFNQFRDSIESHLLNENYDVIHSVLPFNFADIYQPRGGSYPESIIQNANSYNSKALSFVKRLTSKLNRRRQSLAKAEKQYCNNTNGLVLCLSDYVARQFKSHYDINKDRIVVVENGINPQISTGGEIEQISNKIYKKGWTENSDNRTIFLFGAHNFRLKGLIYLLRAFSKVLHSHCETKPYLMIAGAGKITKYSDIAKKIGIQENVLFLDRVINIRAALSLSNVAVLPTFYDPCSRFILESLAVTMPVITTSFNGACDLFENNRHGKIIDRPENIEKLAEAMTFYCNNENVAVAQKAILDDKLVGKVSIKRHVEELVEVYDKFTKS